MATKEITVPASIEFMDDVLNFINAELAVIQCPKKSMARIGIAVDDIFTNISNYAYTPDVGYVTVRAEVCTNPLTIRIEFADSGIPYNPLEKEDPDTTLSLHEREVGGLGILLVKKTMDSVEYRYENGQNILTISKLLF